MTDNTNWIRIRCELCGSDSKTENDWSGIHCQKYGNPVCGRCCHKCEHKNHASTRCTYKSPERIRYEAHKKAEERFNAENRRVTEIYLERRREAARQYAIKKAKAEKRAKRKAQKKEAQNDKR